MHIAAALVLLVAQAAPATADEAEYLDVWSRGYSRFEIDDGNVVAFFTNGVEFDYLAFHATAQELRYNHATKVAIATGGVTLELDGSRATCAVLSIDGRGGTAVLDGGVEAILRLDAWEAPAMTSHDDQVSSFGSEDSAIPASVRSDVYLTCERILLNFPSDDLGSGMLNLGMSDIDAQLVGPVVVTDDAGRSLRCAEARFNYQRMQFSIPGRFEFRGGPQPLIANLAPELTADVVARGHALRLKLDPVKGLRCAGMQVTTASVQALLTGIRATDLTNADGAEGWQAFSLRVDTVYSTAKQGSGPPVAYAARDLMAKVNADGTAEAIIAGGIAGNAAAGAFHANTLELALLKDGSIVLNQPFVAEFDVATMSGLDPISLMDLRSPKPR